LKGDATTGIDSSPAAIERAKRNALRAGAMVDFRIADATRLDGFENRFDPVVDSAFYHVFLDDEETQGHLQALHRATRPGARLFMFEFGRHNVNGVHFEGLSADNFERALPRSGWRIDYLATTTYQGNPSSEVLANMPRLCGRQPIAERMAPLQDQLPRDRAVAGESLASHAVLGCGGRPA
jgi:SAM-dependent methyltransferase